MSDGNVLGDLFSVNGPRFDLFGSAFDFSDAVFLDMVLYLQGTDKALSAKLQEIRDLEATKERLTQKLEWLQTALRRSSAKEDGDFVYVPGSLTDPTNPDESPYMGDFDAQHEREKEIKFAVDTTRVMTQQEAQQQHFYRKDRVEGEIESVRNELEQLNSASQIFMIDLQRLLNQRNQAVEMTSNIIAKEDRTNRGIIENLK